MVVVFSGGGTGGHLYPALAIASALRAILPEVESHFVGAERGIEARILPERGLPHTLVDVEGLRRGQALGNLGVIRRLVAATASLVRPLRKLAPGAVVLTGGYASAPAGLAAFFLGIPVVVQEQNEMPGLTTRLMARWAKQIHLAYPEAAKGLPVAARSRVLETGNPIKPPVHVDKAEARRIFGLPAEGRVVLAVGGSQGSEALNRILVDAVRRGQAGASEALLWATGPGHFSAVQEALGEVHIPSVKLLPYIDDMPHALAVSDLAISRAGAMTTSELLAWGVPTILIPLPTAAADHQTRNAEALEDAGVAVHLPQEGLDGPVVWSHVQRLFDQPRLLEEMANRALERARPNAAEDIAAAIADLLGLGPEAVS